MTGDVVVIGLQPVTCPLPDIAMDVPHGTTVTIPADKAARSKDLWRAVSQRLLFKLDNGSMLVRNVPNPLTSEVATLRERVRVLEEENRLLREEVQRRDSQGHEKLDTILSMLQGGVSSGSKAAVVTPGTPGVVEVEAPPYIPSKIRSEEPLEAHVRPETGSSEGSGVSEAASQLRRLRQRGGQ